jgi:hypothetical protein
MIESFRLAAALADRYRLERELEQGGMATVYLAHPAPLCPSRPGLVPPYPSLSSWPAPSWGPMTSPPEPISSLLWTPPCKGPVTPSSRSVHLECLW